MKKARNASRFGLYLAFPGMVDSLRPLQFDHCLWPKVRNQGTAIVGSRVSTAVMQRATLMKDTGSWLKFNKNGILFTTLTF